MLSKLSYVGVMPVESAIVFAKLVDDGAVSLSRNSFFRLVAFAQAIVEVGNGLRPGAHGVGRHGRGHGVAVAHGAAIRGSALGALRIASIIGINCIIICG